MSSIENPLDDMIENLEQVSLEQSSAPELDSQEAEKTKIRRQVEYYLSDENLVKDGFLKGKMKGRKNKPIPLELIHGFKKMRDFQPFSLVIEAVSGSELLDVVTVEDKECVQRKVPFIQPGHEVKKPKPTGFEANWTEAPITPSEYAEDRQLYNSYETTFVERMETALQRYRSKRRFQPRTANIYTKFLAYGGVDTGQKQYSGGLSREDIENKDTKEIATFTAIDFIGEDKFDTGPDRKWRVDFEEVAKGFLSSHVPLHLAPRNNVEVDEIVNVLRNFYNFLLLHDVCPEYMDSILAAREICNLAERELKCTIRAIDVLPGNFQMACSTLFGGHFQGLYAQDKEWYEEFKSEQQKTYMSHETAKEVFNSSSHSSGLMDSFANQETILDRNMLHNPNIDSIESTAGLEVMEIIAPDAAANASSGTSAPLSSKILGRLICKPWQLPPFAYLNPKASQTIVQRPEKYTFAVEKEVLKCCFQGMKFESTINTLDSGFTFFDNVIGVYCSFYTVPYNEALRQKKKMKVRDAFNDDE